MKKGIKYRHLILVIAIALLLIVPLIAAIKSPELQAALPFLKG